MTKVETILHPVRLRVLLAIAQEQLTTQDIANRLPDIPKSSIYRHLKLLLDEGLLEVTETRLVNGIQEKVYQAAQPTFLGADEMAHLTAEDHIRYFTTFAMTLIQDFALYVKSRQPIDMVADRTGYQEHIFWATAEELDAWAMTVRASFAQIMTNPAGNGRSRHKIVTITHPVNDLWTPSKT